MKKLLLIVISVLIATAGVAAEREWTSEQRAVMEHMNACYQAWADTPADYEAWAKVCRPTRDRLWWWSNETLPINAASHRRFYAGVGSLIKKVHWWDVRFHEVTIAGDIAIVYMSTHGSWTYQNGDDYRWEDRRCEIFRKISGQWHFQGGMVTPVGDQW